MSRTIQGSSTVGIRLTLASDNPVTVLPTGAIDTTGLYAVYGSDAVAWSLINRGKLSGGHNGVTFAGTGTITNGNAAATHASISGGDDGIIITGAAATVVNDGTITGKSATSVGVYLADGGRVTNGAPSITAATISGGRYGVEIAGGSGTIVNRGRIRGGEDTVLVKGGKGTVVNYGTIGASTSVGIALYDGGSVTNGKTGTIISRGLDINVSGSTSSTVTNHGLIIGVRGVYMSGNGGTAINAGTIISSHLEAFSGERMIIDPGAVFAGKVRANVLELAKGATPGTLGLLGARYLDRTLGGTHTVGTIVVDAGAQWTLAGYNTLTSGATLTATGTLTNAGVLRGQGVLVDNGRVVNAGTIGLPIQLALNADSYLLNQETGTILGSVVASNGGGSRLTNSGKIGGGIVATAGFNTLTNLGQIHKNKGEAVRLSTGVVINGSPTNTTADITGLYSGVYFPPHTGALSVINFAHIENGIAGRSDLTVTNGSNDDTSASIVADGSNSSGIFAANATGIYAVGALNVTNFGTVTGSVTGINNRLGSGAVVNGSLTDTSARIFGAGNAIIFNTVDVRNFGTIESDGSGILFTGLGGSVVNGSESDTSARISGGLTGIAAGGEDHITNFGTIVGKVDGIQIGWFGSIVNGSAADTKALIGGDTPIATSVGLSTVVNFGSIISNAGDTGTAISLGEFFYGVGENRLVVAPGAVFVGKAVAAGSGNTLELAKGTATGSIGGIGSQFAGFDTMTIDTGAKWMLTGSNDAGMVTNDGSLSIAAGGTLDVTASVDPLSNGLFQINANSLLEIAANTGAADRMKFLGAGKLTIDAAAQFGAHVGTTTYAGPLIESFVNGDKIDLKDVLLTGALLSYTSATGLLHITQGGAGVATLAFETSSLGAGSFHAANDGTGHLLLTHSQ